MTRLGGEPARAFVESLEFKSHSLICSGPDDASPAQWPHFDVLEGAQVVLACSPGVASTLVYRGDYAAAADVPATITPTELRLRNEEEAVVDLNVVATVVARTRSELASLMTPASDRPLRPGEFSLLVGPVLHAGPATPVAASFSKATRRMCSARSMAAASGTRRRDDKRVECVIQWRGATPRTTKIRQAA